MHPPVIRYRFLVGSKSGVNLRVPVYPYLTFSCCGIACLEHTSYVFQFALLQRIGFVVFSHYASTPHTKAIPTKIAINNSTSPIVVLEVLYV